MADARPASINLARIFLLAGAVAAGGRAGGADAPPPDLPLDRAGLAGRYDVDFRGARYDHRSLRVEGSGIQVALVKPAANGLRVRVPPRPGGSGVGLCTKFGMRGDFEVIATYEILDAPKPASGPGIGVEVVLQGLDDWGDRAALARRVAPRTGDATFAAAVVRGGAAAAGVEGGSLRATAREGRIHLARAGSTVYLHAAEGGGGFRKVAQAEFGTGDIRFVRLQTLFEGADRGLDVLWKDLAVRAGSLPRDPGTLPAGRPRWPALVAAGGVAGLVVAFLVVRRRRRPGAG